MFRQPINRTHSTACAFGRLAALLLATAISMAKCLAELNLEIPSDCKQAVVVIAPDWKSSIGALRCFSRANSNGSWKSVSAPITVLLGENGLGRCAGLRPVAKDWLPQKREGDRRSPAGVFSLTKIFCRENSGGIRMPQILITPTMEAVDDPNSRDYNRVVDRRDIPHPDWKSSERMAKISSYAICVGVASNPTREPGRGSCVFLHLWEGSRSGTAGCTALHPQDMITLVRWLDPSQKPVLIQAPKESAEFLPSAFR